MSNSKSSVIVLNQIFAEFYNWIPSSQSGILHKEAQHTTKFKFNNTRFPLFVTLTHLRNLWKGTCLRAKNIINQWKGKYFYILFPIRISFMKLIVNIHKLLLSWHCVQNCVFAFDGKFPIVTSSISYSAKIAVLKNTCYTE